MAGNRWCAKIDVSCARSTRANDPPAGTATITPCTCAAANSATSFSKSRSARTPTTRSATPSDWDAIWVCRTVNAKGGLLSAQMMAGRCQRPGRCTAKKRNELAPPHAPPRIYGMPGYQTKQQPCHCLSLSYGSATDASCCCAWIASSCRRPINLNTLRPEHLQQEACAELHYSIIMSARANTDGGMVMPSSLAVFRLTMSLNSLASSAGRSPGGIPFSISATYPRRACSHSTVRRSASKRLASARAEELQPNVLAVGIANLLRSFPQSLQRISSAQSHNIAMRLYRAH